MELTNTSSRDLVKSTNAAFIAIVSLCAQFLFPPSGAAGFIPTTESTPREEIVASIGASNGLVLGTFYRVISEGKISGALLVYDDPKTKRPEDYFELYDSDTNLVAAG
jgi:hypothetical protein